MDNEAAKIEALANEQQFLYEKYYQNKATKRDIKRIDEITSELQELNCF